MVIQQLLQTADLTPYLIMRQRLWPECDLNQHKIEVDNIFSTPERMASFIATDDTNNQIGFAEVSIRHTVEGCSTLEVGYLEGWYIEPKYRQKGFGKQLVQTSIDWCREKGCKEFASDCELDNTISEAAHKRIGFKETLRQICFKMDI